MLEAVFGRRWAQYFDLVSLDRWQLRHLKLCWWLVFLLLLFKAIRTYVENVESVYVKNLCQVLEVAMWIRHAERWDGSAWINLRLSLRPRVWMLGSWRVRFTVLKLQHAEVLLLDFFVVRIFLELCGEFAQFFLSTLTLFRIIFLQFDAVDFKDNSIHWLFAFLKALAIHLSMLLISTGADRIVA